MFSWQRCLKFVNFQKGNCSYTSLTRKYCTSTLVFEHLNCDEANNRDSTITSRRIRKYLEQNKYIAKDGYTCVLTYCANCNEKKTGSVYINKTTGFFICMDCEDNGEWSEIDNRFKVCAAVTENSEHKTQIIKNKFKKPKIISEYEVKWNILLKSCKSLSTLSQGEIDEIISTFKLQVPCDSMILGELKALYDDIGKVLYFPLRNSKKRVVGIKKLFTDGTEECCPSKQCYGLLRFIPNRTTKKCENGIIVYNIKDLIALLSPKLSYHIICIPHGMLSLPQEILPLLENYNKLILWFGHDTISLNAARNFSRKLNERRCYIIKSTDKRPSQFIKENEYVNISRICDSSESVLHDCIATFMDLKKEILNELTDEKNVCGTKWSRFPILNDLLKGHRRGELTIITGPTGSGKTTFLSEYSLDIAQQGVSTLWGSFEIRNQRLAYMMLQQLAMEPLNNMEKFEFWSREFEKLPIFYLKFHGQQSIDTVMNVINHAWYVHDIQHVVIDNLQFMLGLSMHEERFIDRFYKQDKVIAAFRTFATQRNCHVTLIIHPRKEKDTEELTISSIFGSAKASQEADNIMIIQKKMLETLHIKKYLQIAKNRYYGELGIMPLNFNKSTLTFSNIKENKENIISRTSKNSNLIVL